ncbi:hypothetical protein DPMN_095742 [Dreissena polymorpha]|uniref:Uncharacterized protein n=1 Tax=Dreissena polymorpha TaxID=45954 RepID=A0A9D4L734_DREPO|nr:hypothetical protein DPMN_095742 [Dreissena polymorpha]
MIRPSFANEVRTTLTDGRTDGYAYDINRRTDRRGADLEGFKLYSYKYETLLPPPRQPSGDSVPVSAVPVSAVPVSAAPVSAVPVSAVPVSAVPVSAVPVSIGWVPVSAGCGITGWGRLGINASFLKGVSGSRKAAQINASFLKGVSGTSSGDTASRRILNTTNIIDPSYQLRCTEYMLRNKDKPVKCQLPLPTKHELYVSGRGAINTNCTGNCSTERI